ncbi:uncharacterized protein LOC108825184 [Raphanus sativus]|uniref:Uncharacterized protein LOC108825184 n=1 Tax=Raphanus sativus TaxID=3726 RepID=A0A9W3CH55_RAPSA|nr:uncharacterized protein LOC108825184 [Raphanus sativus]
MSKQIDELRSSQNQQTEELGSKINALEALIEKYFANAPPPQRDGKQTDASSDITDGTPQAKAPPDRSNPENSSFKPHDNNNPPIHHSLSARLTKIGFPMFDGSELREWTYGCEQFFSIDSTPPELKVRLASLHMTGKALQWHHSYLANRYNIFSLWPEYVAAISDRLSELYDDPLAELVSLKQGNDTIDVYLDKFDCAMTRITLAPDHALSIFLTNMNQHLALHVRQFKVSTVPEAAKIAKLHELSLSHMPTKTSRPPFNSSQRSNYSQPNKSQNHNSTSPTTTANPNNKPLIANAPQKWLSFDEMQERKRKGLCMFCEEPFTPGHHLKHKRAEFLFLDLDAETEFDDEIALVEQIRETTISDDDDKVPTISVHALNGAPTFNCMRLVRKYEKRKLHILIDPGSTHNFLDIQMAKGLGCSLTPIKPMSVVAASGDLVTKYKCSSFAWKMQGYGFTAEIRTLPLGCSDLVLGVQWLSTLGPILWDFLNLRMEFKFNELKHVLRGISPNSSKLISGSSFNKLMLQDPQLALLHLREIDETTEQEPLEPETIFCHIEASETENDNSGSLERLLDSYTDVFDEPSTLPPYRAGFNHKIPLEAGSNPVNLRPYRYSSIQKDSIDKMIQDMLSQGIIQYSASPYASPIVLVKKKDGSWRLCVDYRGLNKQTIKDKYPIPLLEDLLDELGGSKYFSKLDLRAGFHQLCMSPEDVHKTAFKTHSGHYEYLVMPFGLTNAPCTFQGLMNHVFAPVLRKFLLVFFDDILIYSKTWEEHLDHLDKVLAILRHQQLYLKKSKCTFGGTRIEYLGHFISHDGVSTDPTKIKAVEEWPQPKHQKHLRSFLGLANYYRRFIQGYSIIARPLTIMLRKDGFAWNTEASDAFHLLKQALISAPVLALPDFSKTFIVETDASNTGIGAILMQDNHPVCYISRALGPRHQGLSVYEKELLAVVHAVQTWNPYLAHNNIKKARKTSLQMLYLESPIITDLQNKPGSHAAYSFVNGELRRRGKLVVGNDPAIKLHIFKWLHDSAVGGHSGRDATLHRINSLFFWPKMSLEPLPVPTGVWESVSLDFIEGLPPSSGKHCILVVIDRLSKNAHFLALSHPYTAMDVAKLYMDQVFRLHGMPKDITSDRDPTFLSEVWREMFRVHVSI